ncbi:enolase-phosphatase E1 [Luteibacter jiangsuensis]|uniref:Enolase-phosphatase E1 n=1 Tax=Luteibacter jiangsuensis TaxID=637577 RepID=A0ABT9SSV9_9GAMM|nr:acireductone synthase [Luteibacter jiangsuensis]MDQ0008075.1 enolase-phosphatase E1 [Luteibacter jiangsuensis]
MSDIRAVLTDIEGTTSSIDFVKDVLFPYARKHLPAYVETHTDEAEVQHWLHEAAKEAGIMEATRGEIIDLLIRWIDEDRKSTALKALQGMIWREGYESGVYVSHMYPEVADRLRAWHAQGLKLYVYSSGSVPAQKLLFGFTGDGDLTPLFSGYFDTQTGHKREVESYRRIAGAIGLPPAQVLFLSDIREELDAARDAGMRTTQLVRPPLSMTDNGHPAVTDFNAITP